MTAGEALVMYRRLQGGHWPLLRLPWEGQQIEVILWDEGLLGMRRDHRGEVVQIAAMPDYVWNMGREFLPGAELADMLQRRPIEEVQGRTPLDVKLSEEDSKKLPILTDHLTQTKWEDGTPRDTSKLNLWHDGTMYKLMLRDVAQGMVLFVASPSLTKALSVMEGVLGSPTADWRPDKAEQYRKKGKK